MKRRKGWIYEINCKVDCKGYVGQTIKEPPTKRWKEHLAAARNGNQRPLYRAMRRYGFENFTFDPLYKVPEYKLDSSEKRSIRELKTFIDTGWGYNLTKGGQGRNRGGVSNYTRRKLSRSLRRANKADPTIAQRVSAGNCADYAANPDRAKKASERYYSGLGERMVAGTIAANKLRDVTDETSAKLSVAGKARRHSEASKQKMSKAHKALCERNGPRLVLAKERGTHSKNAKKQWKTMRPAMIASIRAAVVKSDYRAKRSEIAKAQWARMRDKMCAGLKAGHNTPSAKANHAKSTKRGWASGAFKGNFKKAA